MLVRSLHQDGPGRLGTLVPSGGRVVAATGDVVLFGPQESGRDLALAAGVVPYVPVYHAQRDGFFVN